MALDTKDKKWIYGTINKAINKSREVFNADMVRQTDILYEKFKGDIERNTGVLYEKFNDDITKLKELTPRGLSFEEVMEIIREDGRKRQIELDIFREEVSLLRREVDIHERRLNTLEAA